MIFKKFFLFEVYEKKVKKFQKLKNSEIQNFEKFNYSYKVLCINFLIISLYMEYIVITFLGVSSWVRLFSVKIHNNWVFKLSNLKKKRSSFLKNFLFF